MGLRAECLVCGGYLSDIYDAFRNGECCPNCGASKEMTDALKEANEIKKRLRGQQIESKLVEQNTKLVKENNILKEHIRSIEGLLSSVSYHFDELHSNLEEQFTKRQELKERLEAL